MSTSIHAVYGTMPQDLVDVPDDSVQCSPRRPGAQILSKMAVEGCVGFVMHAPASTLERRHELALALKALMPGAPLTAVAANTKGGNRLVAELTALGCEAVSSPKRHHQVVRALRPESTPAFEEVIASAIEDGGPRLLPELEMWSQPGLFSWDRIDPGSKLLIDHLPKLAGCGADLGCGIGILARAVLATGSHDIKPGVNAGGIGHLSLVDIDHRALLMARRNVPGANVSTVWTDVRSAKGLPTRLDFVVANPPFHDGGDEDKALGQAFIERAAGMLRAGGVLWLIANRHLPYEATLNAVFADVVQIDQAFGYKIYKATKGAEAEAPGRARAARPRR
ncbi:MAG: methyltransferase [Alphaproteobacteria bacterium]|nr:methyltransferase [Alphaproteobacteria bacterium]